MVVTADGYGYQTSAPSRKTTATVDRPSTALLTHPGGLDGILAGFAVILPVRPLAFAGAVADLGCQHNTHGHNQHG